MFRRTPKPEPEGPFWAQRGWLYSAAFLTVVVFSAVVVWATGAGGDAAAPESSLPKSGPAGERPGGCRTDDSDTTRPTDAPPEVDWRQLDGAKVPISETAGPAMENDAVLWCFARSPVGAVLAAHVIPTRMGGPDWRAVTKDQVVPGHGRDMYLIRRGPGDGSGQASEKTAFYAGFSLEEYSAKEARVRLLIAQDSRTYVSTRVHLLWHEGDWKVRPMDSGAMYSPVKPETRPKNFVMWEH